MQRSIAQQRLDELAPAREAVDRAWSHLFGYLTQTETDSQSELYQHVRKLERHAWGLLEKLDSDREDIRIEHHDKETRAQYRGD